MEENNRGLLHTATSTSSNKQYKGFKDGLLAEEDEVADLIAVNPKQKLNPFMLID